MKIQFDDFFACDARSSYVRVDLLGNAVPAVDESLRLGWGEATVGRCEDREGQQQGYGSRWLEEMHFRNGDCSRSCRPSRSRGSQRKEVWKRLIVDFDRMR